MFYFHSIMASLDNKSIESAKQMGGNGVTFAVRFDGDSVKDFMSRMTAQLPLTYLGVRLCRQTLDRIRRV